jgi:YrbI family 3-deoxy-D-manno-octulosonate 8-phosphate phosphatase
LSQFARNLIFFRQQKGLKIEEMARFLDVWDNNLRRYEQGKEEPDLSTLLQIAEKLETTTDHLLKRDLDGQQHRIRRQKIRLILLDVDGTLTDGGLYYGEKGEQLKKFDVKDGMAIARVLKHHPVRIGFISASSTEALIKNRADALNVPYVYAGKRPKVKIAEGWMGEMAINWKQVAFVGDDLSDIEIMKKAGFSACPSDAAAQVKEVADFVLSKKGGEGCIRELLEDVFRYRLMF